MIASTVANPILNSFFARGSSGAGLANECWIGMSTTVPTFSNGTINGFTEPSPTTGYKRSRLGINGNTATYIMDAAQNSAITNGTNFIFFDEATTGQGGFGKLVWFGLFSAETGGSPLIAGALTSEVTVNEGYVLIFRPNNLTVSME